MSESSVASRPYRPADIAPRARHPGAGLRCRGAQAPGALLGLVAGLACPGPGRRPPGHRGGAERDPWPASSARITAGSSSVPRRSRESSPATASPTPRSGEWGISMINSVMKGTDASGGRLGPAVEQALEEAHRPRGNRNIPRAQGQARPRSRPLPGQAGFDLPGAVRPAGPGPPSPPAWRPSPRGSGTPIPGGGGSLPPGDGRALPPAGW